MSSNPTHYKPNQTALLLLDFHAYFFKVHDVNAMHEALKQATTIRQWAISKGIEVVHCLIDLDQAPFKTSKNSSRLSGVLADAKQTGLASEHEALSGGSHGEEKVFIRQAGKVSATESPKLTQYLHDNGITSLLLAGLSTSGCVLHTAYAAIDQEFVITVIGDACADPKEGVHEFVLSNLLGGAYVQHVEEVQKSLEKAWHQ